MIRLTISNSKMKQLINMSAKAQKAGDKSVN